MVDIIDLEKITDFIHDGMEIMIGGFGGCGTPRKIFKRISETDVSDLTLITNAYF